MWKSDNQGVKEETFIQTGGERGQWAEGFSGTTVKDTWTKPRGRVEAGRGGREGGLSGVGEGGGEKMETTVIEQQ